MQTNARASEEVVEHGADWQDICFMQFIGTTDDHMQKASCAHPDLDLLGGAGVPRMKISQDWPPVGRPWDATVPAPPSAPKSAPPSAPKSAPPSAPPSALLAPPSTPAEAKATAVANQVDPDLQRPIPRECPWKNHVLAPLPQFERRESYWPKNYGVWGHTEWNTDHNAALENSIATELGLPWWIRGPPGPELGGPEKWKTVPWNPDTQHWTWTRASVREHIPEYNWEDWNSKEALDEEHAMACLHHLPWPVRGPPGPKNGGPKSWRGMVYRENSGKWMSRGGTKTNQA